MLWAIIRGDTDGDIIDYIEADDRDTAEEIALDRHKPDWRERLAESRYPQDRWESTWDCIYAREASPWLPRVKEWFSKKKKEAQERIDFYHDTSNLLKAAWEEIELRKRPGFKSGPAFSHREPESLEPWEMPQKRSLGIKFNNCLANDDTLEIIPPRVLFLDIYSGLKNDPQKLFWNDRVAKVAALQDLARSFELW